MQSQEYVRLVGSMCVCVCDVRRNISCLFYMASLERISSQFQTSFSLYTPNTRVCARVCIIIMCDIWRIFRFRYQQMATLP